jgi:hypothetical protein
MMAATWLAVMSCSMNAGTSTRCAIASS